MEKLLQQIRDNLRFANWCFFPGNCVDILYHDYSDGTSSQIFIYKRKDKDGTWISEIVIQKFFDEKNRLVREEYHQFPKLKEDGTNNI